MYGKINTKVILLFFILFLNIYAADEIIYQPILGIIGNDSKLGFGYIKLNKVTDFFAGDKIRIKVGGTAKKIVVRLLKKGQSNNNIPDNLHNIISVPQDRIVEVELAEDKESIFLISVHGGNNPWGKISLGAENGPAKIIEAYHLTKKIYSDLKKENANNELIQVYKAGNLELLKKLIENGVDVNTIGMSGDTLLTLAAKNGDFKILNFLLEKKTNINIQDCHGTTAFMNAMDANELEIADFLLEKGANINLRDKDGFTALIREVRAGNLDKVKYLIEKGADVNVKDNHGNTALLRASRIEKIEIINLLLEKGADINVKNDFKNTALMKAAREGNLEVVKVLVTKGAEINENGMNGSALMNAIIVDNIDTNLLKNIDKLKMKDNEKIAASLKKSISMKEN